MTALSEAPARFRSSAVRPGPIGLVRDGFVDVLSRRRLVGYLVRADMKKKGADSLLGNIWWIVDPLLQMLVYVVLVSFIFAKQIPDYPLFVFTAILPWKWFSSAINDGTGSVVGMERLIKQINFPKLVLPVAADVAGIVNFVFGLIPMMALMILFYSDRISPWLLLIPVVAAVQFIWTLPLTMLLGAINVFYRDVNNLSRHVLRLWFYLSPALYSAAQIESLGKSHPTVAFLMNLNPWAPLFTAYRDLIYSEQSPDWLSLAGVTGFSLVLLVFAIWVFKRLEPTFAKVL